MSWSSQYIGTPEAVCKALDKQAETMSGQSKQEFEEAVPAIKALLALNVDGNALRLTANGHATFNPDGTKSHGYTAVNIEGLYGRLVTE